VTKAMTQVVHLLCGARAGRARRCDRHIAMAWVAEDGLLVTDPATPVFIHTPTGFRGVLAPCSRHGMMMIGEEVILAALDAGQRAVHLIQRAEMLTTPGHSKKRPASTTPL